MPYWRKNAVPEKEGWYWCKYRGKHGMTVCPCQVYHFGNGFLVRTARNDTYSSNNRIEFGSIWFGEELPVPSLKG